VDIEAEARELADEVLRYFGDLEAIGAFAGQSVDDNKRIFLTRTLANFARKAARGRPITPAG
jgi:hypothetical protein